MRNFYSVSISGYHIAEAGANPITQLALNTGQRLHLRGVLSLPGDAHRQLRPEPVLLLLERHGPRVHGHRPRGPAHLGRRHEAQVRRLRALPELKYHIQTSGRSLHSQDIQFNDIRTTLQALCAIYDNCNSLHTNAFDEAITTPSSESVRRALAIQLIINREWGLAKNENMNQGSFIVEELTRLVEEAVLAEFDRITERGGVLGAMETGYQRSKIQEESLYYEALKHTGELPLIGVNTFRDPHALEDQLSETVELARATEEEKQSQLAAAGRLQAAQRKGIGGGPATAAADRPERREYLCRAHEHGALLQPGANHPGAVRGRGEIPTKHVGKSRLRSFYDLVFAGGENQKGEKQ